MKKTLCILSFALLFQTTLFADEPSSFSCSSHECGDLAELAGIGIGEMVAVFAPHFLTPAKMIPGDKRFSLGIGEHHLKEFIVDMRSGLTQQDDFLLITNFNIQLYNDKAPSMIRYGLGGAYKYNFDQNFILATSLDVSIEKIEKNTNLEVGPELNINLQNRFNDNLGFELMAKSIWYKNPYWKLSTGVNIAMNSSVPYEAMSIMLSYQRNHFIGKKILSFEIGWIF